MLLSTRALKSQISVDNIQPKMMCASFISSYSPTNASDETDIITFYNGLSSLVRSIPKHNVPIIGGDMNAQIGIEKN